jgi:hypothetical protein
MKYNKTVTQTPTGKWHIVGSDIPTEYSGVFDTEEQAKKALIAINLKVEVEKYVPKEFADNHIVICI